MSTSAAAPRARLLALSVQVADLDADLPDPLAQDRLEATVQALAHALVDLADGQDRPTRHTPWPVRTAADPPPVATCSPAAAATAAACSAMAAELERLLGQVRQLGSTSAPLWPRLEGAGAQLQRGLQSFAQALPRSPDGGLEATWAAGAELDRRLRRAHRLLQPDRTAGRSGS